MKKPRIRGFRKRLALHVDTQRAGACHSRSIESVQTFEVWHATLEHEYPQFLIHAAGNLASLLWGLESKRAVPTCSSQDAVGRNDAKLTDVCMRRLIPQSFGQVSVLKTCSEDGLLFSYSLSQWALNTQSRPRSRDRPLYARRGGLKGAGGSSTDSNIAVNIDRGF